MRLILWPGAIPITFKTVAGEREYKIKEDVYAYLIQSKNGNIFTLDHENNLRAVNSRNSYLDSLDDSELLKYLRNAFGISQREMAKMYGVRQCQVAHWENRLRRIPARTTSKNSGHTAESIHARHHGRRITGKKGKLK